MARSWMAALSGSALSGAVLIGALLSGCAGVVPGSAPEAQPETTGTEPGATTATGQPTTTDLATETGGPESTGAAETGQSVDSPRLPVGGDTEFTEVEAEQCARVSFLGQDENSIPTGGSIVVTGAVFSAGLFEVGGSACDDLAAGEPVCLDGFVFTADDTGPCVVPVHTDVTRPDGTTDQAPDQLRLTGRLQCPTEQRDACRDLAGRLDVDDQAIDLFPPVDRPTEPTAEATGTSAEPTGTTAEATGTTAEPTGTTAEPTGTTVEPTGASSQPTSSGAGD